MKVAVIGVGNISVEHINAYLNNPRVEVVAFCDSDVEQLKRRGEEYSITRLYTDVDQMFLEGEDTR